jgi:hypothetical protein
MSSLSIQIPIDYTKASPKRRKLAREAYIRSQQGMCFHCGDDLNIPASLEFRKFFINESLFPKGFFNHPIHLHHDHNTGMTIGAVHCDCNAVLWQYHGE